MLIDKKKRLAIYETLFKEGVLVAKKDFNMPKHPLVENVTNLQVIKVMQSLKSRGYAKESFSWCHYYWYLTNEGIEYLRTYLNLPPEIIPATLKKQQRSDASKIRADMSKARAGDMSSMRGAPAAGDRSAYRKATEKRADAGPGVGNIEFRGGFGRGKSLQ